MGSKPAGSAKLPAVQRPAKMPSTKQQRKLVEEKMRALGFNVAQITPAGNGQWRVRVRNFDATRATPSLRNGISRVSTGVGTGTQMGHAGQQGVPANRLRGTNSNIGQMPGIGSGSAAMPGPRGPGGIVRGGAMSGGGEEGPDGVLPDGGGSGGGDNGPGGGSGGGEEGPGGALPGGGGSGGGDEGPGGGGGEEGPGGTLPDGGGSGGGDEGPGGGEEGPPDSGGDGGGGGGGDGDLISGRMSNRAATNMSGNAANATINVSFSSSGALTISNKSLHNAGLAANPAQLQSQGIMLK